MADQQLMFGLDPVIEPALEAAKGVQRRALAKKAKEKARKERRNMLRRARYRQKTAPRLRDERGVIVIFEGTVKPFAELVE